LNPELEDDKSYSQITFSSAMEKDAGGKHHPKKLVVKLQPEAMSGRRWLRQQGVVTWWCA